MGVDILPSELPREASAYFGDRVAPIVVALIKAGLSGAALPPHIAGACVTDGGRLMPAYAYIRCPLRSTLTVLYHGRPRTGTLIGCARRGGPCSAAASQHANGSAPPRDGGGARRGGRPDDGGAAAAWAPLRLQPDQPGQFSITCMRLTRPSTVSNEGCLHFLQLFSPLYVFLLLLAPCARAHALARSHTQCHTHITGAVSFGVRRGRGPAARALAQVLALLDASGVSFSLGECLGNPGAKTTALIALGPLADPAVLDTVIEKVTPAPAPAPALVRTHERKHMHATRTRARTQAGKAHTHSPLSASMCGWVPVFGRMAGYVFKTAIIIPEETG